MSKSNVKALDFLVLVVRPIFVSLLSGPNSQFLSSNKEHDFAFLGAYIRLVHFRQPTWFSFSFGLLVLWSFLI